MEYSAGCFCIKCSMTQCFTLINTDNCNLEDYWPLSLFFFFFFNKSISIEKDAIPVPEQARGARR